jgi:hypothetical protein
MKLAQYLDDNFWMRMAAIEHYTELLKVTLHEDLNESGRIIRMS